MNTAGEGGHGEVDEQEVEDREGESKAQRNRTESLKEWQIGGKRGVDGGGVAWQGMTGRIRCRERIGRGHISNLFSHKTCDTWLCQSASASHINCPHCSCWADSTGKFLQWIKRTFLNKLIRPDSRRTFIEGIFRFVAGLWSSHWILVLQFIVTLKGSLSPNSINMNLMVCSQNQ